MSSLEPVNGIVVVGDVSFDTTIVVDRLPTADDKVTGRVVAAGPGGMAANVAYTIASLGGSARIFSIVGSDGEGRTSLSALERVGVDSRYVHTLKGEATFRCIILLDHEGEKALVRLPGGSYQPRVEALVPEVVAGMRHLHTTFGDPGVAVAALRLARNSGLTTSLDLEEEDFTRAATPMIEALELLDVLFVNRRAHDGLGERLTTGISWPATVVTTLGGDGSWLRHRGMEARVSGHDVKVLDTTGAGDAFAGAFLQAFLRDNDPVGALEVANAVAAVSTTAYGAQSALPTQAALAAFISGREGER